MVHRLRVLIAVVTIGSASAVMAAAPARADEDKYLKVLQPAYVYLSEQQLLAEGYKVCDAKNSGVTSMDAITMVVNDLTVSVATAANILTAAVTKLDC